MIMTVVDQEASANATQCYINNERLDRLVVRIMDKVRDHNHISGKYQGAAHNNCTSSCISILRELRCQLPSTPSSEAMMVNKLLQ